MFEPEVTVLLPCLFYETFCISRCLCFVYAYSNDDWTPQFPGWRSRRIVQRLARPKSVILMSTSLVVLRGEWFQASGRD